MQSWTGTMMAVYTRRVTLVIVMPARNMEVRSAGTEHGIDSDSMHADLA